MPMIMTLPLMETSRTRTPDADTHLQESNVRPVHGVRRLLIAPRVKSSEFWDAVDAVFGPRLGRSYAADMYLPGVAGQMN